MNSNHAARAALALALVLGACGPSPTATIPPDDGTGDVRPEVFDLPIDPNVETESGQAIAERVQACWASGDAGAADELAACYSADARVSLVGFVPSMTATGGNGAVQLLAGFGDAFPDLKHDIELVMVNGREVVVVVVARGTNTAEMQGQPATGKAIGLRGAQYLSLDDEYLADIDEHYVDQLTLLGQLGQVPAAGHPVIVTPRDLLVSISDGGDAEAANLAVLRKHGDAFNRHAVDDVMKYYAANAVFSIQASPADLIGKPAIAEVLAAYYAISSDVTSSVEWMFAAGDYVAARLTVTGINDGAFPGGTPATKKTFTTDEMNLFRFEDGRIVEHHIFSNGLQFPFQLGLWRP